MTSVPMLSGLGVRGSSSRTLEMWNGPTTHTEQNRLPSRTTTSMESTTTRCLKIPATRLGTTTRSRIYVPMASASTEGASVGIQVAILTLKTVGVLTVWAHRLTGSAEPISVAKHLNYTSPTTDVTSRTGRGKRWSG